MPRMKGRLCVMRSVAVVPLFVTIVICDPSARAPAQISDFSVDAAAVSVTCPATEGLYYALLRGDEVSAATSTVRVTLSDPHGLVEFRHESEGGLDTSCGFYAVLGVPMTTPLDMDGDGMDDVFELGLEFLDPLDPSDANADDDFDGVSNLREYRQGRSLSSGVVPGTMEDVGLQVFAPPAW